MHEREIQVLNADEGAHSKQKMNFESQCPYGKRIFLA